jgi:hypothetical protein
MMRARAIPASGPTVAFRRAATRTRQRAETYAADVKAKLCIAADQVSAWSEFADALFCNHRRMAGCNANRAEAFGMLTDRLAALERMRHAGRELLDVLSPEQQHVATRLLPLCCLPPSPASSLAAASSSTHPAERP